MANNKVEITLGIKADVQSAKQQIQSLASDLQKLSQASSFNQSGLTSGLAKDIVDASNAALQLKQNIERAINVDTGKLNLSKFHAQLQASGMTLKDYQQKLSALGPAGDAAFSKLATSIQYAEIPLRQTTGLLDKFFDGLKNTFMWTLQSQAIHGFQSALSGAYTYAQQLNKGLTDIAIVSDLTGNQLADFAKTANQMAKDLSASTSEVVSGALIYYQAGLNDEEVINRTETTIKLAQTSGESAEQISSYMTAIWNNFEDGSKSVEYYADVISYLGAVTAASNADIAEGIQSFAATADTVGLSFEYAAGALTVLRDVTQQSASTIGNSLKTIFARLSSVKQGETLEDDVDFTKYTQALADVGVNVLKANGDLKEMDQILDELAARWDLLNNAQKVALAQTVGGVRQYNNLISLMDNYERFQELVSGAEGSEGYLQKQADVYADSWEGASDRAKAAWQEFYQEIINDKFFIGLKKIEAGFASLLTTITKGLGGVQGLISAVGVIFLNLFGDRLASGMRAIAYNLGYQRQELEQLQQTAIDMQVNSFLDAAEPDSLYADNIILYKEKLTEYNSVKSELTAGEREWYQSILDTNRGIIERIKLLTDEANAEQQAQKGRVNGAMAVAEQTAPGKGRQAFSESYNKFTNTQDKFLNAQSAYDAVRGITKEYFTDDSGIVEYEKMFQAFRDRIASLSLPDETIPLFEVIEQTLDSTKIEAEEKIAFIEQVLENAKNDIADFEGEADTAEQEFVQMSTALGVSESTVQKITSGYKNYANAVLDAKEGTAELNDNLSNLNITGAQVKDVFSNVVNTSMVALRFITAANSIKGIIDGVSEGTTSWGQALTSLSSILLFTLLPALQQLDWTLKSTQIGATIAAVYALIMVLDLLAKHITEQRYLESAQKKFDDLTEVIDKQKNRVKELANAYSSLESILSGLTNTYDKLAEAAEKYGKNSAQYQLLLIEYNEKLAELEEKYGSDIYVDPNAEIRQIDENKLAEIALQQYNSAKIIQQSLENQQKQVAIDVLREKAESGVLGSPHNGVYYTPTGQKISGRRAVVINQATEELYDLINQKSVDPTTVQELREKFNSFDDEVKELLNNLLNQYLEAMHDLSSNTTDFSDIARSALQANGMYDAAEHFNINSEAIDGAINKYIENRSNLLKTNTATQKDAKQFFAQTQGYEYDEESDSYFDSDGNIVDSNIIPKIEDLIKNYVAAGVISALENPDSKEYETILDNAGITGSMREEFKKLQEEYATEQIRTQGAREDFNNNANGFSKKELASIESLVEELKTGELYADKFSEKTLETEGSVQKLAFAIKQADQGIKEWTKSWYDWRDAIENSERGSSEYIEAMDELKDAASDLLGITDELSIEGMHLGSVFGKYVAENLDTVYDAFSGSQEAALEMQKWAAEDIARQLAEANNQTQIEADNNVAAVLGMMDAVQNALDSGDLQFGRVDDTALLDSLNNIINSIAKTVPEAEAMLAAMGFDAEVVEDTQTSERVGMTWKPATYGTVNQRIGVDGTSTLITPYIAEQGEWIPDSTTETIKSHALKIKTADFVGGGNITASKGGGGSRAPKKSGGGGGGSKQQKTKEKDTTRYHEITQRLEQNQHALTMLNAQEDRAYGQKKLDMMEQKIQLLQQQEKLYEQLAKEAKNYYDSDREKLHNTYGAAFNSDGTIKDYDSWYDSFVDKYNAGQMSDDEWKKFENAIKKYEESLKKMNEAEEKLQKNLFEQYDTKLEEVEYKLKTITDLIKMDMEYLDYMINMLDDDGLDTAEAIGYLAKEIDDVTKQYAANKEALEGIFKNHEGITDQIIDDLFSGAITVDQFIEKVGDFTAKEIESLQSIMSSMFKNGEELKKYIDSLYDKLNELSDKFQESIDKAIDKLNHMNNMIEKTRNIIDIMGKDTLGISDELLNRMQRAQIEIGKEHIATLQQELEQYRLWLTQEEALYATMDPDSLEARALREVIENYRKTISSLEEEILDTAADTAEKIKQIYQDMIQQAIDEMGKQISGRVGDFEKLLDLYEKQKKLDDRYLDTYEKTYQTNKLLRDIRKSLDDTDNLRTQELLRDLQGEILDMQKEGVQVAEEQLQERRLYYELLLAEAALQEAQDAKNMVRMTRDSEGNWSYTYTADQGKVDDLRQKYDDALHAYEEFNENTLQTMQDTLLQMQEEYSNALAEAQTADEVRALEEYYEPMIDHQRQMIDYFIDRNNELVENFNVNADQVSTTLGDTVYGMVTGFETMDEAAQAMDQAYDEVKNHVINYLGQMEQEQQTLAGVVHTTEPEINTDLDKIEQGVADVNKEVDKVSEEFNDEFNDAIGTLTDFHNTMGPIIQGIVNELGKITNKVGDVITAYSQLNATPITTPDLSGPIGAFQALEAAANAAATAAKNAANSNSSPQTTPTPTPSRGAGRANYGFNFGLKSGGYIGHGANAIVGAATGMYTGAWGEEGKLAVLHEKELVLNKHDTENMLKTVGFVRDLTQMISLNASVAGQGLGNLFLGGVSQGGGFLDQNVTIHAEFPNATNHTEIEEAFSNLIGLASQYAGRKK